MSDVNRLRSRTDRQALVLVNASRNYRDLVNPDEAKSIDVDSAAAMVTEERVVIRPEVGFTRLPPSEVCRAVALCGFAVLRRASGGLDSGPARRLGLRPDCAVG